MEIKANGNGIVYYMDGDAQKVNNVEFEFNCPSLPGLGFAEVIFDALYAYGYRMKLYVFRDNPSPPKRAYYDSPVGINNQ